MDARTAETVENLPPPWVYFTLVAVLSIPFWGLGAAGDRLPLPMQLPISALMAVVPALASAVLVLRSSGAKSMAAYLMRAFDVARIGDWRWVLAAVGVVPAAFTAMYFVQSAIGGALPPPSLTAAQFASFLTLFFVGGCLEELGWQGYAFDRLAQRMRSLDAALFIGVLWALWHVIPLIEAGRGGEWIVWQCLVTVAFRVLTIWLYLNAGRSVFVAALFHTSCNMSWSVYPTYGSHYDPVLAFFVLAVVCLAIAAIWGRDLVRRAA